MNLSKLCVRFCVVHDVFSSKNPKEMCVKLYFRLLFFAMQEIEVKCKRNVKVPAALLGGVFLSTVFSVPAARLSGI